MYVQYNVVNMHFIVLLTFMLNAFVICLGVVDVF